MKPGSNLTEWVLLGKRVLICTRRSVTSQKPKKLSEKQTSKSVLQLFSSGGTNAELLLMETFCTCNMSRYYKLCEQFHFSDGWEPQSFEQRLFKNCSRIAIFFWSGLVVCQAASSKIIIYLTTTLKLRSGGKWYCSALTSSSGGKYALEIN